MQQVIKTTTRNYCSHLKTFLEIPGPKPLPLIINSLLFSPLGEHVDIDKEYFFSFFVFSFF